MKLIILLFSLFIFLSPQFIIAKDCPTCKGANLPIGFGLLSHPGITEAMIYNPQSLHYYVYVGNNPVKYTDPFALKKCEEETTEWYKNV